MRKLLIATILSVVFACSNDGDNAVMCDGDASRANCDCEFESEEVFLVSGTGADCVISSKEQTACFKQTNTCLNDCIAEFYRYELDDGTAIIFRGLQGTITEGWKSDGQSLIPASCPILEDEFESFDF